MKYCCKKWAKIMKNYRGEDKYYNGTTMVYYFENGYGTKIEVKNECPFCGKELKCYVKNVSN